MSRLQLITNRIKNIEPVKLIVLSFFVVIVLGTILLSLPISCRDGEAPRFIDSLFVATSSTCVTGLTVFDTGSKWSFFGQFVILILTQVGGLGVISFTTGITLFLRKRLGIRDLQIIKEYTNGSIVDIHGLIRSIFIVSFSCEALGALLLSIRFIPKFGLVGIWVSIFTAISAYCNSGFDVMGILTPNISMMDYANDPLVCIVIDCLVIIGGIGFIVITDVHNYFVNKYKNKAKSVKLGIHSIIVIYTSLILLVVGTILFFSLENNNTLLGYNLWEKLNISFFQSAVARTAGFFSIPIGKEKDITKIMTIILMFIGASPSSTGGGIKTTTFIVLIATVISVLKGYSNTCIRRHIIDKSTVYKTLSISTLAMMLVILFTSIVDLAEASKGFGVLNILFEIVSAFSTVGLTTGITPFLGDLSKVIIIITMFVGRVGPVSLLFALTVRHSKRIETILPEGKVIVG